MVCIALTSRPNASQKGQLLFFAILALKALSCVSWQDLKAEMPAKVSPGRRNNLINPREKAHVLTVLFFFCTDQQAGLG